MSVRQVTKIVSGGQTGVDRAALDVAVFLEIPHGGWCPLGRRAEDGRIPVCYELSETTERGYSFRTEKNVIDSDGTLILYRGSMSGGTELTERLARKHHRPCCCIDLEAEGIERQESQTAVVNWITNSNIGIVNVAGPRESTSPGVAKSAESFLIQVFGPSTANDNPG